MRNDDVILDGRTQRDLCERAADLAQSYTPEWHFDRENPDIGSALALIFTDQMAENIQRLNRLPEKYHTEFVNLMGLSLQPAYPASGIAVARMIRGTVPGTALPRGSRLMAEGADGTPILFETMEDVYLTSARITDILSLSGTRGRILPLLGGLKPAELIPTASAEAAAEAAEMAEMIPEEEPQLGRFEMFRYDEPGIERSALVIAHRTVFSTEPGVPVLVALMGENGKSLSEELSDPELWRWSYHSADGLVPFDRVEVQNGVLVLGRDGESAPVRLEDGEDYHVITLESLRPVTESTQLTDLRIASQGDGVKPEIVISNGEELNTDSFLPFGDEVSMFDECYVGDDRIFSQQGAEITLSFRLDIRKKLVDLSAQQAADELKIIKRKPRAVQYQVAETSPQRITVEYFNGIGWRKLSCSDDASAMMDGTHRGEMTMTFLCPEDWTPLPVGGYAGRSIRLRVAQADNCYLLPCEHTMPVVEGLTLSYHYTGSWKQPQKLRTVCGTQKEDCTDLLISGEPIAAFRPLPYPPASLYLGFDRPLEGAPVSLLFDVEENVHFRMEPVEFEYSTRTGFKRLKVVDGTRNFSGAGTILFMPPSDFAPVEVEGLRRWWLRLCGEAAAEQGYHAPIRAIALNALDIRNQQTRDEETFFINAAVPDMSFPLSARNILEAEVFVSELGQYSRSQMEEMERKNPQDVRLTYDFMGEITECFVRWTEVSSFDISGPDDRHYMIDRMNNTILFGDGVHVRIPQARDGVAFTVKCISCDGARGNIKAGGINTFFGNVMYVESVVNPVDTYAGSDLETPEAARRRGADLLSSRGRLISEQDFIRAVAAFSGSVEKVKCVAGRDIDGRHDPSLITIAVMTRDYGEGAYAFNNIREPLRRQLLERCDATVTPDCLVLSEPVYVEISVTVWVKVDNAARSFDVQNLILNSINDFIEPLGSASHKGWDIGSLPSENQLNMLLQSLRLQGRIFRMIASARYVDRQGVHEVSLDHLPNNPFLIGINGDHKVYIEF